MSAIKAIFAVAVCYPGGQAAPPDPPHLSAIPTLKESQNWARQEIRGRDQPEVSEAGR